MLDEKEIGYNVNYPLFSELTKEQRLEVIDQLLNYFKLRILRDSTPDYTEIRLVPQGKPPIL